MESNKETGEVKGESRGRHLNYVLNIQMDLGACLCTFLNQDQKAPHVAKRILKDSVTALCCCCHRDVMQQQMNKRWLKGLKEKEGLFSHDWEDTQFTRQGLY